MKRTYQHVNREETVDRILTSKTYQSGDAFYAHDMVKRMYIKLSCVEDALDFLLKENKLQYDHDFTTKKFKAKFFNTIKLNHKLASWTPPKEARYHCDSPWLNRGEVG